MSEDRERTRQNTRFGNYKLQTRTLSDDADRTVQMALEDIVAAQKRVFGSSAECGKFLDEWRAEK